MKWFVTRTVQGNEYICPMSGCPDIGQMYSLPWTEYICPMSGCPDFKDADEARAWLYGDRPVRDSDYGLLMLVEVHATESVQVKRTLVPYRQPVVRE